MEEVDLSTQKQAFDIETEPLSPNKNPVVPATYACKFIRLNPGVSALNFASCMVNSTVIVFAFIITGMLQPLILTDKEYFNVGQQYAGSITSLALFVDLIVKMIVLVPYGYCSDKLGRRVIIYYGATSFVAGCILMSAQTSVFPGFILAKILMANGSSALHAAPLLADYTADESKGRAAGLSVLFIGMTSVVANLFIKVLLYEKMSLGKCYFITGLVVVSIIFVNSLGLKKGTYHAPTNTDTDHSDASSTAETTSSIRLQPTTNLSIMSKFKDAARIFRENGWLQIALILHVVASSSTFIFFTYMSLYVKSMFPEDDEDNTANLAVNNIQTFSILPSFLSTLTFGYLLDKKNKAFKMSFVAIAGVVIAFILMLFANNPSDLTIIFAAILMGTKPGIFVLSNYLSIKNYPADKRGVMVGFMGMVSNTVYFLIASSAGLLYDNWMKKGPFIFGIGLLVIGLFLIFAIYRTKIMPKGL